MKKANSANPTTDQLEIERLRALEKATREELNQLKQSNLQAQQYLDIAGVAMVALDTNQKVVMINQEGCRMLGYPEEEILGTNWFENFLITEDIPAVKNLYHRLMTQQSPIVEYYENPIRTKTGTRLVEWHNSILLDLQKKPIGILSSGLDISERAMAQKALEQANKAEQHISSKYSATFDLAPIGIARVSPEGKFLESNPYWGIITGYSKEEILDLTFQDLTHPDDLEQDLEFVRQLLAGEIQSYTMEKRYFHKKGYIVWVKLIVSLQRKENRDPDFFISIITDITEKKRIEGELAYSEERLRTLLASSQDAIVTIDKDSQVVFWNDGATNIFGYTASEIIGKPLTKIIPKNFRGGHIKGVATVISTGKSRLAGVPLDLVGLRKDQTQVPVELSLSRWELRGQVYFSGIMRDISARKEAEAETKRLTHAIDQLHEIVFITDLKGEIIYSNSAFSKTPEILPKELFAQGAILSACNNYEDPIHQNICEALLQIGTWQGELPLHCHNGDYKYFEVTISLQESDNLESSTLVFVALEITMRRLEQARQIQSQKMESLGTLAGGVAHEINNPIGYVSSNLHSLTGYLKAFGELEDMRSELEEGVRLGENGALQALTKIDKKKKMINYDYIQRDIKLLLADMLDGVDRIKDIVNNLRDFSHVDTHKLEKMDVNLSLQKAVKVAWHSLKFKCAIKEEFSLVPLVECFPQEINQVFLNLIINAMHAIEEKGTITLKTSQIADKIQIQVIDDGVGIKATNIPRLFEPFFTTKPVGKGTGLGLSVSYKIIKDHHGTVEVTSEYGRGCSFTIVLPLKQHLKNPDQGKR
ncbi:MAG: PAS domain S-box protein [SAR324 cluster bacterium]|nr:PAS domain S-box protein [SAR324 cluster bacterium]